MTRTLSSLLSLSRRASMNRWRIANRETGEVVELSSQTFAGACHFLGWPMSKCVGVYEGKQPIMLKPKYYVPPTPGPIKG
jgi:hypothetical protein